MKNKRKSKIIITSLCVVILSILGGVIGFGNQVPRQACACLPPEYVAHFTEEEAIEIIRNRLEEAGLAFASEVPLYSVETWGGGNRWGRNVGIDLFDEDKNIAITLINMYEDAASSISDDGGGFSHNWEANHVKTELSENFEEINFGVFYNPALIREWRTQNRKRSHTTAENEILTERLETQVQEFIAQLQEAGIID